jgi:hypothetical protein
MTGRAEMAALTREGQKILMAAILAPDPGEAVVEDAAIQVAVDHVFHISAEKAVPRVETLVVDPLKFLKMILNASVILGILQATRAVNRRPVGHRMFPSSKEVPDREYCKLNCK